MKIILRGDLPAKKNRIRAAAGRRGSYAGDTGAIIKDLSNQAAVAWRGPGGRLPPVEHPDMLIRLFVFNPAKDRDGIVTTALDALVKGGVLKDDSVKFNNGGVFQLPATLVKTVRDERIEFELLPTGTLEDMLKG